MRTFSPTARQERRPLRRRLPSDPPRTLSILRPTAPTRFGSESGMTLIEVLVAAVIVGVIAVGTFTAFDAAGRTDADSRAHAQATQLAEQDEERLRGLTTTAVAQLGTVETFRAENGACLEKVSATWRYWNQTANFFCEKTAQAGQTYTGIAFAITSSSRYVAATKGAEAAAFTCEKVGSAASFLQTTSSVTWTSLGTRPAVSQSSILTAPVGGVLIVKTVNQNNEPVQGATVTVTGSSLNAAQTTSAGGCVIFGGLAAGAVSMSASKLGWVDKQGKYPSPAVPVTITAGSTTEKTFSLGEPGSIVAEFESNGSPVGVTGDTFYAFQTEIASPNDFVGGTISEYKASSSLSKLLFPFVKVGKPPTAEPYTVFAGDCAANRPSKVTEAAVEKIKDPTAQVEPNGNGVPAVKVEVPAVNVTVFEGASSGAPEKALEGAEFASITTGCTVAELKAQNYAGAVPNQHKVSISTGAGTLKGHLVPKYQPYAKELLLCVTAKLGAKYYRNTFKIANEKKAGTAETSLYLKSTAPTKVEETTIAGKLKCP
jgi:prepilin-type N-terminal cleavage/methylation domain-containing protein